MFLQKITLAVGAVCILVGAGMLGVPAFLIALGVVLAVAAMNPAWEAVEGEE